MGIPRLIATLEPYAVHDVLQHDHAVVIDGPALAYHIQNICAKKGRTLPFYQDLGDTTISWLDELTSHDISITAIYFDGYLPFDKRPVRMQRMLKSLKQLSVFCSENSQGFPPWNRRRKHFLPPSFHVPAIIETLRTSPRYSSLVSLVPGEADAYCAQHLAQHGGTVITSDSDLLVHNLGKGRVVFFRDINVKGDGCAIYSPNEIGQRIGLPSGDICRLAYERQLDVHLTLPQILQNCQQDIKYPESYEKFCQEYLQHEESPLPTSFEGQPVPIFSLDPRLSELVLQLGQSNSNVDQLHQNHFFLPVLIEDTERGSAWEQSTSIRQLAYTFARWLIPGVSSTIQEYRRVNQTEQKGRPVSLLSRVEAKDFADWISDFASQLGRQTITNHNNDHFWTIFCLALDISECLEQGKKSHTLQVLQKSLRSPPRRSDRVDWDVVHFTAQLQASYYSFRILTQILFLIPGTMGDKSVANLQSLLGAFPPLTQSPDIEGIVDFLYRSRNLRVLDTLSKFVDIPKQPRQPTSSSNSYKKKQNPKNPGKGSTSGRTSQPPRNMFDVLNQG